MKIITKLYNMLNRYFQDLSILRNKNEIVLTFMFLIMWLFGPIVYSQQERKPINNNQDYQIAIEKFLEHNFANNHIGLVIQSLDNNKIIYQRNENKLFVPASLLKLFTLAASLKELTPNFKFVTQLKRDPQNIKNNHITGDMALVFSGDPTLTQLDLAKLLSVIKNHNISTIDGNIIIDDTIFSDSYGYGWSNEDLTWYFAAPSGAIVVAENKIPVSIRPINTLDQPVEFFIKEEHKSLYPLTVKSQVVAVTKQQSEMDCNLDVKINENNEIFFSGCAQIDPTTQQINLSLKSPRKYLQGWIQSYLQDNNIKFNGKIIFTKASKALTVLNIHNSLPLTELLKVMMKNSNNIYAHTIGKALGARLYGEGSFKTSSKAILSILQKNFTVNTSTLRMVDNSGLSNYNVASPNHVIRLLQAIYNDKIFRDRVFKILAHSGEDGTLRNRLAANDLRGKIFAKTGSLTNSSGLAGYAVTRNGKTIAFVLMINNMVQNNFQIKQLEDELCELLVNLGPL